MTGLVQWAFEIFFAVPLFLCRWLFKGKLTSAGKCVVITGCDSGVGYSIALVAARLGFEVVATCLDPNGDGAQQLKSSSSSIFVVQMDVTRADSVSEAVEQVKEHLANTQSKLWALVNNAGMLVYGHFDWQLKSQINAQLDVNFIGVLRTTKAFLPLIHRAKGRIVNITSANGHWSLPGLSVYCATKHAVEGFSNSLRMEMLPWGVRVIMINPGNIPKATRIMVRQSEHLQLMKRHFTEEQSQAYGDYFEQFDAYLKKVFPGGVIDAQPLEDSGLKSIIDSALLCQEPKAYYENLTIGFRLFILTTKTLPTFYADRLMIWLWGAAVGHKLM